MKKINIRKHLKKISLLLLVVLLTGCNLATRTTFTFNVETGDSIKVTLKMGDGYSLSQENGTFVVSKDDQTVLQGVFLTKEMYKQYKTIITENKDNAILNTETGKKDDNEYIYYETKGKSGMEYNYIVMINSSDTGVIIGSTVSKEVSQDAFDHLTIVNDIYSV